MMSALQGNYLPSALHVADYMLAIAKRHYDLSLDQLQLNKLLYLTNGFVLRERDEPAFYNDVEAWKYGPVIRAVWETYRVWGYDKIKQLDMCHTSLDDHDAVGKRITELTDIIGEDVAGVVSGVLKEYGKCSGSALIAMTYQNGTPWHEVYRPGIDKVISPDLIAEFYRQLSEHHDVR